MLFRDVEFLRISLGCNETCCDEERVDAGFPIKRKQVRKVTRVTFGVSFESERRDGIPWWRDISCQIQWEVVQ